MRKKALVRLAAVPAITGVVLMLGAGPVQADEATSSEVTLQHYLQDTLATSTRPAALAQGKSADRVRRFLDQAARNGRLVDVAQVRVATVTDPHAGQIDLVWDDGATPQYVGVTNQGFTGNSQTGVGVVFSESPLQAPSAVAAGGLGYEAGYNLTNLYLYSDGCRTVYFDPDYPSAGDEDHWTTSCYQKLAQSGTDRWVYNRWALWDQAKPHWAVRAETIDYTTRSRPWSGHESKVVALTGWTPAKGDSNCSSTYDVTLQVASGVSVKIPIHQCSTTRVLPEATKHSMGMDWDGRASTQLYEDYGMAIRASNTQVVPVMADYLWAEVQYCEVDGPCMPYDPSQYLALTDSGWDSSGGSGGGGCSIASDGIPDGASSDATEAPDDSSAAGSGTLPDVNSTVILDSGTVSSPELVHVGVVREPCR